MIDLTKEQHAYSKEELKARAMSRLSERGLGLAERLANLERIAYHLLDPVAHPLVDRSQVDIIGAMLTAVEAGYNVECADNVKLESALAYEVAERRLAWCVLVLSDTVTQEDVNRDAAERAAAQAIITGASIETVNLVVSRRAIQ